MDGALNSSSWIGRIIVTFQEFGSIEDQKAKNIVVEFVHKKILIRIVKVLLKTLKCTKNDIHNGMGSQHFQFFTTICL